MSTLPLNTTPRLVLLVTSPRVAAGLLSADAWSVLQTGPVFIADSSSPSLVALRAAGVDLRIVEPAGSAGSLADDVVAAATAAGTATWWVGPDGDAGITAAFANRCGAATSLVSLEVMHGSWDVPGARLLDVVATMNRLRSPGGCPWDAEQTHQSLAPYLLEEAYETFEAIELSDTDGLREELGDVLLQIAFHSRLAQELPEEERWSIDDVASGLVDKLIRRHPHVFADVEVDDSDEVNRNWEAIKAAERGDRSVLANVPMSAAALTLAATLQRKAARADIPAYAGGPLRDLAARFDQEPTTELAGEILWAAVWEMAAAGIDAEGALRARSRQFRDQV